MGYSQFLIWATSGKLNVFYDSLRWDDWQREVAQLSADEVIGIFPFLFVDGPPLKDRSRRAIPVAEQYDLQFDIQRQLDT